MGVNKWDFLSLTMETVIVLKHVAVVVLVDVIAAAIAAAIAAVIGAVATASSADLAEGSIKDVVATRDVTPAATVVSLAGLMGSLAGNH
jgi:hypothetical protein